MRKIPFVLLLLLSLNSLGQTEKGNIMTGGQLSLQTNKNSSSFQLNPNFGYFVGNNLALGGHVTLDFGKQGTISASEFGVGPFMRYYIGKTQTKPFLIFTADYLTQSYKTSTQKITNSGYGFLLGMGFAAFLNRNVAVEGIAGYNYADYTNVEGSGGFSLSLGFQLYFGRDVVKDLKRTVTGE